MKVSPYSERYEGFQVTIKLHADVGIWRHCNIDFTLFHAFIQWCYDYLVAMLSGSNIPEEILPSLLSYDAVCGYCINAQTRWRDFFPGLANVIKTPIWLVPLLHVMGHKDACAYLYASSYQQCAAHCHSETAEQPWAEHNQAGPLTCQMNPGHRQDVLNAHFGDWNFKKMHNCGECIRII
jgi:hypothetical protein